MNAPTSDWRAAARASAQRVRDATDAREVADCVRYGTHSWRELRLATGARLDRWAAVPQDSQREHGDAVARWEESDSPGDPPWALDLAHAALSRAQTMTPTEVRKAFRCLEPEGVAALTRRCRPEVARG